MKSERPTDCSRVYMAYQFGRSAYPCIRIQTNGQSPNVLPEEGHLHVPSGPSALIAELGAAKFAQGYALGRYPQATYFSL